MSWTLVVVNALECALAMLYLGVAAHYATHHAPGPTRLFATFWGGIGVYALVEALWSLAVGSLDVPLAFGITALEVKIIAAHVAFFALVAYVLHLYTGRAMLVLVGAYYALLATLLMWDYLRAGPIGQVVQPWRGGLVYAHTPSLLGIVLPLLALAPALAAAVGFALLARHTTDATSRRRVNRLATALIVFFAGLSLGSLNATWYYWPLAEKTLALLAVAAALAAIRARRGGLHAGGAAGVR